MTDRTCQPTTSSVVLVASDRETISCAVSILLNGGVVAIPTDTVYGLAASLARADAIDRLYELKSRPGNKAIPVLVSDPSHVSQVALQTPPVMASLADQFWPGALTLVVEARDDLPAQVISNDLTGKRTVAVRLPNHSVARQIIDAAGGVLAVTSANRSGEPDAITAQQVGELSIAKPDAIVNGGRVVGGVPSTIISVVDSTITILREGAIPASVIFDFLTNLGYGSTVISGSAV
jgi:L-threonylcarbamoyladenylate synthase